MNIEIIVCKTLHLDTSKLHFSVHHIFNKIIFCWICINIFLGEICLARGPELFLSVVDTPGCVETF